MRRRTPPRAVILVVSLVAFSIPRLRFMDEPSGAFFGTATRAQVVSFALRRSSIPSEG